MTAVFVPQCFTEEAREVTESRDWFSERAPDCHLHQVVGSQDLKFEGHLQSKKSKLMLDDSEKP